MRAMQAALFLVAVFQWSPLLAREWTDISGKFKTEAEFFEYDAKTEKVTIEKPDGTKSSLPIKKLSKADQEWVFYHLGREALQAGVQEVLIASQVQGASTAKMKLLEMEAATEISKKLGEMQTSIVWDVIDVEATGGAYHKIKLGPPSIASERYTDTFYLPLSREQILSIGPGSKLVATGPIVLQLGDSFDGSKGVLYWKTPTGRNLYIGLLRPKIDILKEEP